MSRKTMSWMVAGALVLVLAALTLFPAIDLQTSAVFYVAGEGFPWRGAYLGEVVRHNVPPVIIATLVACIPFWLAGLAGYRLLTWIDTRAVIYLIATLLIGPGIIVESILKPNWGRARPDDLALFGGDAAYSPPLFIADACARNCSFVSGHAAVAFWLTAYAFIVPPHWRVRVFLLGLLCGVLVSAMRVMQGAHFLSDVTFAGTFVIGINLLLARVILKRPAPETVP